MKRGGGGFQRRGETFIVHAEDIEGLHDQNPSQGADELLNSIDALKSADIAHMLRDLPPSRGARRSRNRWRTTAAEVLEELPEDDQVEILSSLDLERAADVPRRWNPTTPPTSSVNSDPQLAALLLQRMEPDDAEDIRRLLTYEESTAGGMMTTEPVILSPDATVADALALVRSIDLSPAVASQVYVVRPPVETPTGRVPRRRPLPGDAARTAFDAGVRAGRSGVGGDRTAHPAGQVARYFATYNLVAVPVVDENDHLLGAVTVDDLLDHMLPEDWRDEGQRRGRSRCLTVRAAAPKDRRWTKPYEQGRSLRPSYDPETFGRISERIARYIGSWKFIALMTVLTSSGSGSTSTAPGPGCGGRSVPFIFLTLLLSLQASYAAPLILLAQNRQDDRDRVQYQEDRERTDRLIADTEYLMREIAALRIALGGGHARLPARRDEGPAGRSVGTGGRGPRWASGLSVTSCCLRAA